MKKVTNSVLIVIVLSLAATVAFADRGGFRRKEKKNKLKFEITAPSSLRNSIFQGLRTGMIFKGSQSMMLQKANGGLVDNSIVSFRKGNTFYILPYKQKVITPVYDKSNYKLVFRPK
ncbi:MAG: hypothetical protein ABIN24_15465 [Dyadobacter sp.]